MTVGRAPKQVVCPRVDGGLDSRLRGNDGMVAGMTVGGVPNQVVCPRVDGGLDSRLRGNDGWARDCGMVAGMTVGRGNDGMVAGMTVGLRNMVMPVRGVPRGRGGGVGLSWPRG